MAFMVAFSCILRASRRSTILFSNLFSAPNACQHVRRISLARVARTRFEVAVAKDAPAAPKHPDWGYGYQAALINFAYLAHAVLTTDETVKLMEHI